MMLALIALTAIFSGFVHSLEMTTLKFKMPGTYTTYLEKGHYKIWYFYNRNSENAQEGSMTLKDLFDPTFDISKFLTLPTVSVSSSSGETVSTHSTYGHIWRSDNKHCIALTEFDIPKSSSYVLRSSPGTQRRYVLALVPDRATIASHGLFEGFDDNNFEPSYKTKIRLLLR